MTSMYLLHISSDLLETSFHQQPEPVLTHGRLTLMCPDSQHHNSRFSPNCGTKTYFIVGNNSLSNVVSIRDVSLPAIRMETFYWALFVRRVYVE